MGTLANLIVLNLASILVPSLNRENPSVSDLNYHISIVILLIKTITKFSSVISYHQPDLSTNRTEYASCL